MESASANSPGPIFILLYIRAHDSWKTRIWKKYQHYIDVHGWFLQTPRRKTEVATTSKKSGKMDPPEIERTYNNRLCFTESVHEN